MKGLRELEYIRCVCNGQGSMTESALEKSCDIIEKELKGLEIIKNKYILIPKYECISIEEEPTKEETKLLKELFYKEEI